MSYQHVNPLVLGHLKAFPKFCGEYVEIVFIYEFRDFACQAPSVIIRLMRQGQTYVGKKKHRARKYGFRARSRSKNGQKVLARRRLKGRKRLTAI